MIELLHIDCMEYMKALPNNAFDLAIVDPPYGVGSVTYMPRSRHPAFGGFIDRYDVTVATLDVNQRRRVKTEISHPQCADTTIRNFGDDNVAPPPEYFDELFRVSKHQIIWGGNYFLLPPSRGFIVWDKVQPERFSMAMCEFAWISFNANSKIFRRVPMAGKEGGRIHPTQKPVALYRWILKNYANPGDRILDTHLGSGSIAIACHELGFDLIGCEIDADYYNAAKQRLENFQRQQLLNLNTETDDERPET